MSNISHVKTISAEDLLSSFEEEDKVSGKHSVRNNDDAPITKEELQTLKKENKFYLPVLGINNNEMWDPLPLEERKHFTDKLATDTCLSNCCGVPGLKSACCQLDPDDLEHVLGPVDETWIKKTIAWFGKRNVVMTRHDLVIDFEEGKLIGQTFFHDHAIFKQPGSYPMLRFQINGNRFVCKFLNNETGKCNIYSIRSSMCRNYMCKYITNTYLVRTPDAPNTWRKIK